MKLLVLFCLAIITIGCDKNPTQIIESSTSGIQFNNSDKSIETNGNLDVAFEKCKDISNGTSSPKAERVQVSDLTRSPFSNIGKFILVKGRVFKVEELPPNPNLPGKMTEVLLLADDTNSAVGSTTIDCICIGDTSHVKTNSVASCGGYFIGTYQSENALGGSLEGLAVVGNIAHEN